MQFCIEGYQMPIFVHRGKCPQVPWGVSGVSVLRCSALCCGSVAPSCDYPPSHSSCQSASFIILDYLSNTKPHFKRQKTKTKNPTTENKNRFFPGERISYPMAYRTCILYNSLSPSFPSGTGCLSALPCWNNSRQALPGQFQASLRPENSEGFENQSTCQCLHGDRAIVSRNTIDFLFFKLSIYIRFLVPCISRVEKALEIGIC